MVCLRNTLLIPFNHKDNLGYYYTIKSYDWEKMVISNKHCTIYGGLNDEYNDMSLINLSHTINNIRYDFFGLYGDIETLDTKSGYQLCLFISEGIEFVFRPGNIDALTNSTKHLILSDDIHIFNAILKTNDIYGDIIYRKDKLEKIKNIILKNKNKKWLY